MRLNQIVAVEKGTKNRVHEKLTAIYKTFQKADLFTGHHKTYTPRDEDPSSQFGVKEPDQAKNVQADASKLLADVQNTQTELFDTTYIRDKANCEAKADVVVDGVVVVKDAPVSYLLWLDKQFNDLHTEIKKVPTLDPADKWTWDPNQNMFATSPVETASTKKVTQPLVLAPATKEHQAQVKEVTEDVRAGTWKTIKFSTALPADRKDHILTKVEKLQKAVKQARESANELVIQETESVGKKIFDFVLA
jgi:hypothetical protein